MNTLVQQDKIKFSSAIALFAANTQFMVMVYENQKSKVVIRHIYDQSFQDYSTNYSHGIVSIHLSNSNHLVIVTEINQVDIGYLQAGNSITITSIKAFQKKGLVDVVAGNNFVAMMMTEKKLHILELKENTCTNNQKYDIGGTPVKGTFASENLYILLSDNIIKKWSKGFSGKYEEASQSINLKQPLLNIECIRNNNKNYLICVNQDRQISVIADDGKTVDVLSYEGEFKKLAVNYDMLTVVSRGKESDIFTLFYAQKDYQSQSSRLFFNKSETYVRNSNYKDCEIVPILKKQWAIYNKRKGNKESKGVSEFNEEVFCLVYARLENDPNKLQLLKIDIAKVLNKDRGLDHISRYKKGPSQAESPTKLNSSEKPRSGQFQNPKPPSKEGRQQVANPPPTVIIKKMDLSDNCLKAVEKIVEERVHPLIERIHNIQKKLDSIEYKIYSLNSEQSLAKLYSASLQKEVHALFETKIVPKMEVYFQQIFADLAQVFNQGIEYYNQKLIFQTDLQKNTFKALISQSLNVAKEIIQSTKNDLPQTLKIDALLNACVQKKDQLLKKAEELLNRVQKGPFSYYKSTGDNQIKQQQKKEQKKLDKKQEKKEEKKEEEKNLNQNQSLKSQEKKKKTFIKTNIE